MELVTGKAFGRARAWLGAREKNGFLKRSRDPKRRDMIGWLNASGLRIETAWQSGFAARCAGRVLAWHVLVPVGPGEKPVRCNQVEPGRQGTEYLLVGTRGPAASLQVIVGECGVCTPAL
jgi:hypothetical protein